MKKVTVRKLIEMLAKCNWDAQVKIDFSIEGQKHFESTEAIKSISAFRHQGKPVVTLNVRNI